VLFFEELKIKEKCEIAHMLKKVEQKARHFGQLRYSKMTHVFEKTGPKQDKSKDHGKSK